MDIIEYVTQEGLVMVPVLFILAEIIKHTEVIDNKWVPLSLLVISLLFTPFLLGGFTAMNIVQSVLVAGVTVFGNELVQQTRKEV